MCYINYRGKEIIFMATASYSNQMSIEKKDVKRFLEILSSNKKVPLLRSNAKRATKEEIRKLLKK